ncbi:hypothetical protein DI005_34875 [Prauserella sp. PE36]|uniref:hypothetical protein n=1 Tax=Prauserella sp. PE36 TaxID=1504709 RepID=UPI000DE1E4C5|nr:hypothetical protein [Prauserella sp. PE36]RBM11091.1 hypothetical protein DI005_34875 [Prauserella sp. PE36]
MSIFDVLERFGTLALLRFVGALLLFLMLHLLRIPFVLLVRVLEGVLRRIDGYAARQASRPPARPVNDFFHHTTDFRKGERHAFA